MTHLAAERRPVAAVLAGGQSSRLGVPSKALARLSGKPLLEHVLARLAGQVSSVMISVQQTDPELAGYADELVVDVVQRHRGPLTGLCSALLRLDCRGRDDWLLLCPCDAPFLPLDLAGRLASAVSQTDRPVAVARYQGSLQPVFSLWSQATLPVIRAAVLDQQRGGLMSLLDEVPHVAVDWPEQAPDPFFNVNTPADLEQAERLLDGRRSGADTEA